MKSKYYYQVIKDKEIELETANLEEAIIYSEDIGGEIKKVVEYLGQTLVTGTFGEMTQEQYDEFVDWYYTKPSRNEVLSAITNLVHGGVMKAEITNYYFRELMDKAKRHTDRWSIEEVVGYKPALEILYTRTLSNKLVYDSPDFKINLRQSFQIGGIGIASKVANFPIAKIDEILRRYNTNNNYYDMSCGWGDRLTGALKNGVNYFGTEPNYLLTARLQEFADDWKEITLMKSGVDIRTHGSEVLVEEWGGVMGLCFTSPPYFYLEDYRIGNQSWKEGVTYEAWLENYLRPTIKNCHFYLTENGYFSININNFENFNLVGDTKRIAESEGFELVEELVLENIKRINRSGELNDNNERVMVFMKKEVAHTHKTTIVEQLDLFDFN